MGRKIGTFGLVNYRRHPENQNYIVFGFDSEKEAYIFEAELKKSKVWFEKDVEETKSGTAYLFAVSESSMNEATFANSVVRKETKVRLVKNKLLRYSLLIFIGALLTIAIIGYVKNPKKVQKLIEQEQNDSTNLAE